MQEIQNGVDLVKQILFYELETNHRNALEMVEKESIDLIQMEEFQCMRCIMSSCSSTSRQDAAISASVSRLVATLFSIRFMNSLKMDSTTNFYLNKKLIQKNS